MDGVINSGWAQLDAGNHMAALRIAKTALQDDPNDFEALALLAKAALAADDFETARGASDQLLRLRPDHPAGHVNRFAIALQAGGYEASKQQLESIKSALPNAVETHLELEGLWEYVHGDPSKASRAYRSLLSKTPDDKSLHRMLGLIEYEARNPFGAGDHMAEVLSVDASDSDAMRIMGYAELRAFRFSQAESLAASAREKQPDETPLRWVGWCSRLVWFPPFFIGHILQWISAKAAQSAGPVAGHGANALWAILGVAIISHGANANQVPPYLPLWQSFLLLGGVLAVIWALCVHYLLGDDLSPDYMSLKQREVKLDDY